MAKDKEANDPSNVSAAYAQMAPKWHLVKSLMGGTATMREAGTTYMPQHDGETNSSYNERLAATTLYNVFTLTLEALVGRPFGEKVKPSEDTPKEVSDLFHNLDLQGHDLTAFSRMWFQEGLAKGFCHVLVDMPNTRTEGVVRTLKDDLEDNARPFWKVISPENVVAMYSEVVKGRERLLHVRIMECETVRVGFQEVHKTYIRILEPGMWWLYERIEKEGSKDVEWVLRDSGTTDLDYIPMITFYAGERKGLALAKPPLEDLAYMNVAHWQSTSDQRAVLTVARFPMLAVAGSHEVNGDTMAIGPRQLLGTRDPAGRYYYVEHTGAAIQSGKEDLESLEEIMGNYGAEFLKKKKAASRNPQDRVYDVNEATSELQRIILTFIVAVNAALKITADWQGVAEKDGEVYGGTVHVNNDFTITDSNANDLQHLAQARVNGDISLETYLASLQRLNVIAEEVKLAEEIARIKKERVEKAEFEKQYAPKPVPGGKGTAGLPPKGTEKKSETNPEVDDE